MKIKSIKLFSLIIILFVLSMSVLIHHDWSPVLALILILPALLPIDSSYKPSFVDIYLLFLTGMIYVRLLLGR